MTTTNDLSKTNGNRVEAAIRAADAGLGCATHAIGQMALVG